MLQLLDQTRTRILTYLTKLLLDLWLPKFWVIDSLLSVLVACVVTRACLIRLRAWVARASYAGGARCAPPPLTTPVGVLLENTLHEHGGRCALSYIRAHSTSSSIWLSLLMCAQLSFRLSLSPSAAGLCVFLSLSLSLPPSLSLRLASAPASASVASLASASARSSLGYISNTLKISNKNYSQL